MTTTKPPGRNPSSSSEERGGWEAGRFPRRGRGIPPWRSRSRRPQEIYRRGYHYPAPGPMDQVDAIVCLAEPPLPTYSDPARTLYDRTVPCVWSSPGRVIQSLDASFFFFKCATVTVFSSIRTKFRHIVASEELRVILELARFARLGIGESVGRLQRGFVGDGGATWPWLGLADNEGSSL